MRLLLLFSLLVGPEFDELLAPPAPAPLLLLLLLLLSPPLLLLLLLLLLSLLLVSLLLVGLELGEVLPPPPFPFEVGESVGLELGEVLPPPPFPFEVGESVGLELGEVLPPPPLPLVGELEGELSSLVGDWPPFPPPPVVVRVRDEDDDSGELEGLLDEYVLEGDDEERVELIDRVRLPCKRGPTRMRSYVPGRAVRGG